MKLQTPVNADDLLTLRNYLEGTSVPLVTAMQRLTIDADLRLTLDAVEEHLVQCRTCKKWTDVAVIEDSRCPACSMAFGISKP